MSYIGKILIVVQVVLSLLFMAFAGAVYQMQTNWKLKYAAAQESVTDAQQQKKTADELRSTAQRDFESKLSKAEQDKTKAEALNRRLEALRADLQEKYNTLELQRESQTGLAQAKQAEARFRQEEAERQRIENGKLQAKLDQLSAENRTVHDDLFTLEDKFRGLNEVYESNLKQLAYLQRVVANQGIETDPEVVAKQQTPPSPVEGLIVKVRKNRAGRVQFVEGSIGSDDGLKKGDHLDVIHVASQDRADWLGKVRVVNMGPNWFVGEVDLPSKNGIIQEGDNVTTRL